MSRKSQAYDQRCSSETPREEKTSTVSPSIHNPFKLMVTQPSIGILWCCRSSVRVKKKYSQLLNRAAARCWRLEEGTLWKHLVRLCIYTFGFCSHFSVTFCVSAWATSYLLMYSILRYIQASVHLSHQGSLWTRVFPAFFPAFWWALLGHRPVQKFGPSVLGQRPGQNLFSACSRVGA